jgi:hypothetical protein
LSRKLTLTKLLASVQKKCSKKRKKKKIRRSKKRTERTTAVALKPTIKPLPKAVGFMKWMKTVSVNILTMLV